MWLDHRAAMVIQPAFEARRATRPGRRGGTVCRSAAETFVASLRPADAIDAAKADSKLALSRKSLAGDRRTEGAAWPHRFPAPRGPARRWSLWAAPINRCARAARVRPWLWADLNTRCRRPVGGRGRAPKAAGAHPLDDSTDTCRHLPGAGRPARPPAIFHAPAASPESHPNNLPHRQTSLIGRQRHELLQLAVLLRRGRSDHRHRPPAGWARRGSRSEACLAQLAQHEDGVWLVELAPVSDPGDVLAAVASAMSISIQAGEDPPTSLVERLARGGAGSCWTIAST